MATRSDGEPFTSEAFRYFWEDVANKRAVPTGVDDLKVGDQPEGRVSGSADHPLFWDKPNAEFLPLLAGARRCSSSGPATTSRSSTRNTPMRRAEEAVKDPGQPSWAALHNRRDNQYRNDIRSCRRSTPGCCKTSRRGAYVFAQPVLLPCRRKGQQLPQMPTRWCSQTDLKLIPPAAAIGLAGAQHPLRQLHLPQGEGRQAAEGLGRLG
jgi:peptide/nickel transport system substrate-binding protein